MAAKLKALQAWCRKQCEGYRDVDIVNMTTSWKSGLAFCAIIHRFRPDLIDYDSLDKENVYENNHLAFTVAKEKLGIPALLDAEDMVAMDVPDRLCMCTYVSQYCNYFQGKPQLGGPGVNKAGKKSTNETLSSSTAEMKRPAMTTIQDESKNNIAMDETTTKEKKGEIVVGRKSTYGDTCAVCEGKVYLVERHIENGCLYHRRCFRDQQKTASTASLRRSSTNIANITQSPNKGPVSSVNVSKVNTPNVPKSNASDVNLTQSRTQGINSSATNTDPKVPKPDSSFTSQSSSSWKITSAADMLKARNEENQREPLTKTSTVITMPGSSFIKEKVSEIASSSAPTTISANGFSNRASNAFVISNIKNAQPTNQSQLSSVKSTAAYIAVTSVKSTLPSNTVTVNSNNLSQSSSYAAPASLAGRSIFLNTTKPSTPVTATNSTVNSFTSSSMKPSAVHATVSVPASSNLYANNEPSVKSDNEKNQPAVDIKTTFAGKYSTPSVVHSVALSSKADVKPSTPTVTSVAQSSKSDIKASSAPSTITSVSHPLRPDVKIFSTTSSGVSRLAALFTTSSTTARSSTAINFMPVSTSITVAVSASNTVTTAVVSSKNMLIISTTAISSNRQTFTAAICTNSIGGLSRDMGAKSGKVIADTKTVGKHSDITLLEHDIKKPAIDKSEPIVSDLLKSLAEIRKQNQVGSSSDAISAVGQIKPQFSTAATAKTTTTTSKSTPFTSATTSNEANSVVKVQISNNFKDNISVTGNSTKTTPANTDFASVILKQVGGVRSQQKNVTVGNNEVSVTFPYAIQNPSKLETVSNVAVSRPNGREISSGLNTPSSTNNLSTVSVTRPVSSVTRPIPSVSTISVTSNTSTNSQQKNNTANGGLADTPKSIMKRRTEVPPAPANLGSDNNAFNKATPISTDSKKFSAFFLKDSMAEINTKEADEAENDMSPKRIKSQKVKPAWQIEVEARQGKLATPNSLRVNNDDQSARTLKSDNYDQLKSTAHDRKEVTESKLLQQSTKGDKQVIEVEISAPKTSQPSAIKSIAVNPQSSLSKYAVPEPKSDQPSNGKMLLPVIGSKKIDEDKLLPEKNESKPKETVINKDKIGLKTFENDSSLAMSKRENTEKNDDKPLQRVDTITAADFVSRISKQVGPKKPANNAAPCDSNIRQTINGPSPIISSNTPRFNTNALKNSTFYVSDNDSGPSYQSTPIVPPGERKKISAPTAWQDLSLNEADNYGRKKINVDMQFSFNSSDFDNSKVQHFSEQPPSWIKTRPLPTVPACSVPKRKVSAETWSNPVDLEEQIVGIDRQLRDMEHEGRDLEESIRSTDGEENDEEMMLKWFELVNKKNELVRMETDLMYKLQQQQLEELHAEIEHELRCLMEKPDHELTSSERVRISALLQELESTVLERNSIVDSIEANRQRYLLEDEEIASVLATKFLSVEKSKKGKQKKNKKKQSSLRKK